MRTRTLLAVMTTLILGLAASQAGADCGDDPDNLFRLANCDFDSDTSGWSPSGSTVSWEPTDGDPEGGSLEAAGTSVIDVIGPCVAAQPSTLYGLGGRVRLITGSVSDCAIGFTEWTGANCTLVPSSLAGASFMPPTGSWTNGHNDATTSASAVSVSVFLTCNGTGTLRLDNVYLGEGLTTPVELSTFTIE